FGYCRRRGNRSRKVSILHRGEPKRLFCVKFKNKKRIKFVFGGDRSTNLEFSTLAPLLAIPCYAVGFLSGYLLSSSFSSFFIAINSSLSAEMSTKYSLSSVADFGLHSKSNFILINLLFSVGSFKSSKDRFGSINVINLYSGCLSDESWSNQSMIS